MTHAAAIEIDPVILETAKDPSFPTGHQALRGLLSQAAAYVETLRRRSNEIGRAMIGRVRGTGPGVSFGAVVETVRSAFEVSLVSPFEGSHSVAGGELLPERAGIVGRDDGFLFLRFAAKCRDLPLHTHDTSERLIYVLDGRGFFHVADRAPESASDRCIRHIPVRSRDVLMFRRGTVHTFSTGDEPLLLLSYHAPFIPLEDPRQYTLTPTRVLPSEFNDTSRSRVSCDPAWTRLV